MEAVASGSGMRTVEKRRRDSSPSEEMFTSKRLQTWYYVLGPESDRESERTESIHSIQDKSTDIVKDTSDTCSTSSSFEEDMVQFEVVSTSDGENKNPFDSSDDSIPEDIFKSKITAKLTSLLESSSVADSSSFTTSPSSSDKEDPELTPADYWSCVKCQARNNNPMFRYCERCFKIRKDFFPPRPKPKKGSKLKKTKTRRKMRPNSRRLSREEGKEVSLSSTVTTVSSCASPATTGSSWSSGGGESQRAEDLCGVCLVNPKDGGYVHTNIVHLYNCYQCSMKILKQRGSCPICNLRVRQVVRVIAY